MLIHTKPVSLLATVMFTTLLGTSCVTPPLAPLDFSFIGVAVKGPNGEILKVPTQYNFVPLSGNQYTVEFSILRHRDLGALPLTVSLIEEAQGTNTGGLFSLKSITIPAGAANTVAKGSSTLFLRCNGRSIEGDYRTGGNNPDSGLGGHDLFGDHPAHVHASVGPWDAKSDTLFFMCPQ